MLLSELGVHLEVFDREKAKRAVLKVSFCCCCTCCLKLCKVVTKFNRNDQEYAGIFRKNQA